jgi:hypothetical protein
MFTEADPTHTYSRKEALADRALVDPGPLARELGFRRPVALSAAVWPTRVRVPDGATGQDERGRHWDVLWTMHLAAKKAPPGARGVRFEVRVNNGRWPVRVELYAVCCPDDDGTPCVTVMLPHEAEA